MSQLADTGAGAASLAPPPEPNVDRQRRGRQRRADARAGLALISPTLVIVVVMVVLPILWTFSMAFQRIRLLNLRRAGIFGDYTLANFRGIFTSEGFWTSLWTTLVYSVCGTASAIVLGLIAALALRKAFRGRTFVRAAMLLPYVAPVVAATFAWSTMLSPQFGIVNYWGQRLLGWDEPIAFLSQVGVALPTVIAFEAWRSFPFAFLFLTARLQAVPATLEEAAHVDGATPTQRFWHVILPQLLPTIAVLSVLRFIWTFNSFDDIYLLTGGGAGTEVVSVRVFNALTARGDIGAASAQALVLALILAVLVGLYLRRFRTQEEGA
ncbi:MAG TPA: sugar ABC transporter permease [Propionibacteriaceae bacterium]|nr:sugar ABC transporter permease [Propionibacteriaceae bacterium]